MPAHLKEIGGKAARLALPAAALGSLCSFATNEQPTINQGTEAVAAAVGSPSNFGHNIIALTGLHFPSDPLEINRSSWPDGTFNVPVTVSSQPIKTHQTSKPESALPKSYTVESGDSFSAIATKLQFSKYGWNLFNLVRDNNLEPWSLLVPGEVLKVPHLGEASGQSEPLTPPAPAKPVQPTTTTTSHNTVSAASVSRPTNTASQGVAGTEYASASTIACISQRENGGSYGRSTNPTHFGKYQFSYSLWVANGGSPSTWGNASPAEQDAVFQHTIAQPGGVLNWTPYDGC